MNTDFETVSAFVEKIVREGKVPGAVVAIGVGDEPTRFIAAGKAGFGADDAAVSADTLWRIYSMTKPVTGLAAMILIDEGRLRLDRPLRDILPEFGAPRVLADPAQGLETRPARGTITIRQLMTHTAGLNYAVVADTPARKALYQSGVAPFQASAVVEADARITRAPTLQEFARRAGAAPLVADPGTQWNYSMGLDVLAAVVERIGGMPFADFVQARILGPLEMTSTGWQVSPLDVDRFASSYAPEALAAAMWPGLTQPATAAMALIDDAKGSVYLQPPSFPYGGAGLVSTARDYDRFLRMLQQSGTLDGARILGPEATRLAQSNLLPADLFLEGSGPIPAEERFGFGAGGFVTLNEADRFGRGRGTFGWDGAAGSRAWVDPVRRLRVTLMINVFGSVAIGNALDEAIAASV